MERKIALPTGTTGGIGRACAQRLAAQGAADVSDTRQSAHYVQAACGCVLALTAQRGQYPFSRTPSRGQAQPGRGALTCQRLQALRSRLADTWDWLQPAG